MHKYTNTQVYKCTNTQTHTYKCKVQSAGTHLSVDHQVSAALAHCTHHLFLDAHFLCQLYYHEANEVETCHEKENCLKIRKRPTLRCIVWLCALQGCINCGILVSRIRARGVSLEHMENMEVFSCSPT